MNGIFFLLAFLSCFSLGYLEAGIAKGERNQLDQNGKEEIHSGLLGTTRMEVISGLPDGQNTIKPISIEFAIAPIIKGQPAYGKSTFVKSDGEGKYRISLPPGEYWVGSKDKVIDPVHYLESSLQFSEERVLVKEGEFTSLDLLILGYAS